MRFYKKINATSINAVELDAVQVGFECLIIHFFKSDTRHSLAPAGAQARQKFFYFLLARDTALFATGKLAPAGGGNNANSFIDYF